MLNFTNIGGAAALSDFPSHGLLIKIHRYKNTRMSMLFPEIGIFSFFVFHFMGPKTKNNSYISPVPQPVELAKQTTTVISGVSRLMPGEVKDKE